MNRKKMFVSMQAAYIGKADKYVSGMRTKGLNIIMYIQLLSMHYYVLGTRYVFRRNHFC